MFPHQHGWAHLRLNPNFVLSSFGVSGCDFLPVTWRAGEYGDSILEMSKLAMWAVPNHM